VYVCALRPRGEPLSRADVFGYIARLRRGGDERVTSVVDGPFAAVAVARPDELRPQLARWRTLTAAGDVRLDNGAELAARAGVRRVDIESDLQLVLAAYDECGEGIIRDILGDFAFVVWDPGAQKLLAVRDAFGVKPLHMRETGELALFSSGAGPLQHGEHYDLEFIRAQLTGFRRPVGRTIWHGVVPVPPGSVTRVRGTVATTERYWTPDEFVPATDGDERANCLRFRQLLEEGVRTRVEHAGDVWAYLSGGLDSSSVVSLARVIRASGSRLAGTVTFVDSMGDGDEREYSDAVVERYQLRNEQLRDYWPWQDDGAPPPLTDQPAPMYPFFARERRVVELVRGAGARVMLSGIGADHYLTGSLDYITDLASRRHFRAAVREVVRWSVATRQSFWRLGRRFLLDPFLPAALHGSSAEPPPEWLTMGRPYERNGAVRGGPGRAGGRFARVIATALGTLPSWYERTVLGSGVEVRYPFLYRPLVEWSLRLPPTQRIRPFERKWILREATRDVLPEKVRSRTTKGGIDARLLWSLSRERRRIDALLRDPILAQLGCIDPVRLRLEVERARRGVPVHNVQLMCALSLETWLAVRNGRWEAVPDATATAA
jgi:asparagine synthetase B (glutamine-hydrolysing)